MNRIGRWLNMHIAVTHIWLLFVLWLAMLDFFAWIHPGVAGLSFVAICAAWAIAWRYRRHAKVVAVNITETWEYDHE